MVFFCCIGNEVERQRVAVGMNALFPSTLGPAKYDQVIVFSHLGLTFDINGFRPAGGFGARSIGGSFSSKKLRAPAW
jgi:hypothetical protein